ncbi:hypothetical protein B0H10DRAFT_1947109 [Mycena sp. CBHHK59/15]|nr:hypothetical protein B0H10DRAFT_1947109 [Mycena sp. CBHHK59/15]
MADRQGAQGSRQARVRIGQEITICEPRLREHNTVAGWQASGVAGRTGAGSWRKRAADNGQLEPGGSRSEVRRRIYWHGKDRVEGATFGRVEEAGKQESGVAANRWAVGGHIQVQSRQRGTTGVARPKKNRGQGREAAGAGAPRGERKKAEDRVNRSSIMTDVKSVTSPHHLIPPKIPPAKTTTFLHPLPAGKVELGSNSSHTRDHHCISTCSVLVTPQQRGIEPRRSTIFGAAGARRTAPPQRHKAPRRIGQRRRRMKCDRIW